MRPWLIGAAFLLWKWGKALILYSLYGVSAGEVLSGLRLCPQQC